MGHVVPFYGQPPPARFSARRSLKIFCIALPSRVEGIRYITREILRLRKFESEAVEEQWRGACSSIRYRLASAIGDLLPRSEAEPLIETISDEENPFVVRWQHLEKLRHLLVRNWGKTATIKLAMKAINDSRKDISTFLNNLPSNNLPSS